MTLALPRGDGRRITPATLSDADPTTQSRRRFAPLPRWLTGPAAAVLAGPYRRWAWAGLGVLAVAVVGGGGTAAYVAWGDSAQRQLAVTPGPVYPYSTPDQRTPDRLRVLFLGNSFTQFNGGIALSLRELAASARQQPAPVFDQVTRFGATWAEMWSETPALAEIRQGRWDYVVLQDYSRAAMIYRSEMDQYGRMFAGAIRDAGAKPLFFMTWARSDEPQTQRMITGAYTTVAAANHATVVPAGVAWAASLHGRPRLTLHVADKKHPTPAGTYLTACVFYAVLYHRSPHGLTPVVRDGTKVYIALPRSDATYLQDVAWQAVQGAGRSAATRPATRPATGPAAPPVTRPSAS